MYLTYFDETGSTGTNYADSQQPIQGLWSVSIHDTQMRDVKDSYLQVVAKHFPDKQGLFLNTPGYEFHAADMLHQKRIFESRSVQEIQELFQDITNIIADHQLPVTGVFAQKQRATDILKWYEPPKEFGNKRPKNLDEMLFSLLFRGLATVLADPRTSERIALIGDCGSARPGRSDDIRKMLSWDEAGKLVQPVRFIESHLSVGIQLADVVAYLLQRKFTRPQAENRAADYLIDALDARGENDDLRVNKINKEGVFAFRAGWAMR